MRFIRHIIRHIGLFHSSSYILIRFTFHKCVGPTISQISDKAFHKECYKFYNVISRAFIQVSWGQRNLRQFAGFGLLFHLFFKKV